MRAATSVAASTEPSGAGGVRMARSGTPATTAGTAVIMVTDGNAPLPRGMYSATDFIGVKRSPAKAPGRISFSHMASGFCSSWKWRMFSMPKRIASTTSLSTRSKARSNSASVAFRLPSFRSALSRSRPKRSSAASPSLRTASMIGTTFSVKDDRSVSERRRSAARAASSSFASSWKETSDIGITST